MKVSYVSILVTFSIILFFNEVLGDESQPQPHHKRRVKKGRKHHKTTTTILPLENNEIEVKEESYFEQKKAPEEVISRKVLLQKLAEDSKINDKSTSETSSSASSEQENVLTVIEDKEIAPLVDPCSLKHCGAGKVCEIDQDALPQCICIPECPYENDARRRVCTNYNETWGSDCDVYRKRCLCEAGSPECTRPDYAHVHIEYYGDCREMPECLPEQMADFPRRMREWLFNIMRDMADRDELTPHFLKLEKEAETNLTRRWTNAAVWKFCDLDGHPADRSVSRHELFPIRAPLMALEHCIAPFLNQCDSDDNHLITLKEWAKCLELEEDDLEDHCGEVRGDEEEPIKN